MRERRSGSRPKTRTDELRARWRAVLSWSMLAAAAAHAAVFALGPVWRVSDPVVNGGSRMVSIEPMVVPGPRPSAESGSAIRLSSTEALHPDPAEQDAPPLPGSVDDLPLVDFPRPSIVEPLSAEPELSASPRLELVVLAQPSSLNTGIESTTPARAWRDIRNPNEIVRFLRERSNPVLELTGARGYATIAVWINMRGRVVYSEIHGSSGTKALDEIALELINEVTSFTPGRIIGGKPLTMAVITIPFTTPW